MTLMLSLNSRVIKLLPRPKLNGAHSGRVVVENGLTYRQSKCRARRGSLRPAGQKMKGTSRDGLGTLDKFLVGFFH